MSSAAAPSTTDLIAQQWRVYRRAALPRRCSPFLLHRVRMAFYAGVAAGLAELAASGFDVDTVDQMSDEIEARMQELMAAL